jgi:hypothetical protein
VVNRPHAVNLNFGYSLPEASKYWKNSFTTRVLDGWHLAGVGTLYFGQPLTISCATSAGGTTPSVNGAPIGYWTGTPTGAIPFRCGMAGNLWLQSGATPSSVNSTSDPRLWYPFNPASFTLPGPATEGIGSTPPTLTYGPGIVSFDLSLFKEVQITERKRLQFGIQAFNAFNHFNPGNPNTTLTFNFSQACMQGGGCVNTNASFGAITTAAIQARHAEASVRFSF